MTQNQQTQQPQTPCRGTHRQGTGSGLSIIPSIAQARDDGGLDIEVGLPPAAPPPT